MHIVKSTDDFKIASVARPGFPIILHEDMSSCEEANGFLRHYLMRGQIGSQKSWEPTGRAMYDYFSFLEAHALAWDDVDRGEDKALIEAYRDYCFDHAGLKRNTVRQRVLYVCEFYEWAHKNGRIQRVPFHWEDRAISHAGSKLAHVDASGGTTKVRSPMPRKHKTLPKYLTRDEVKSLVLAAVNPHHKMLIRLALGSGMRRSELATFPSAYVFDPDKRKGTARNVSIVLDPQDGTGMKTKGSKERTIYITRRLMKDLHQYLVQMRGERATEADDNKTLFLNQFGESFADDGKGIERFVGELGKKIGLQMKLNPHMLRHTYATHTLATSQRHRGDGSIEPLTFLQRQLGHASIQTTMIYLHLVNDLADDAVLAYAEELDELEVTMSEQR